MKNKKVLIILLLILLIPLTGCTKNLLDEKKKPVTNEVTGQRLVKNILCQPEDERTIEIYQEHNVELDKLPKCSKFSVSSGGYEGIWTTIFVKPLAWFILFLGNLVKSYGLAVILTTILIRLIMYPVTRKTALQSENMKKAKPELEKLEKKYKNITTQEIQMQKTQEMMQIYKKYQISPFSGCLFAVLQIPLFFAFFEALNRLPAIFETKFLGYQLGTSPLTGLTNNQWQYLLIIVLVISTTFFSFKFNSALANDENQEKQMKMMTSMSTVFISVASFTVSTGIALYWIFNSGFTIVQNLIVKRRKKNANII